MRAKADTVNLRFHACEACPICDLVPSLVQKEKN